MTIGCASCSWESTAGPRQTGGGNLPHELAELTFKPNSDSGEHKHGVTETFYVLEGQLTQVVNGKPIQIADARFGGRKTPTRNGVFKVYRKSKNHVSSKRPWSEKPCEMSTRPSSFSAADCP